MSRTKKFKVVIENQSFFDDLIWMSYRYCIGRRTIAACTHADNLVKYVDLFSEKRKEFMAQDIRREINRVAGISYNISIEGYQDKYDAYSLIFEYLMNHPEIKDDTKQHWDVNVETGEVICVEYINPEKRYIESVLNSYTDMSPWIKLSSYLDRNKHLLIHTDYDGKKDIVTCFEHIYVFQNNIKKLYIPIDGYLSRPFSNIHIAEEYINIE